MERESRHRREIGVVVAVVVLLLAMAAAVWWLISSSSGGLDDANRRVESVVGDPASKPESRPQAVVESVPLESNRASASEDPEAEVSFDLTGIVRQPNGTRVVGAAITARPLSSWEDLKTKEVAKPVRASSGTDGGFLLEKIACRPLFLVAESPDGAAAVAVLDRSWLVPRPVRLGPIALVQEPGVAVEGRLAASDPNFLSDPTLRVTYELMRRGPGGEPLWCDLGVAMGASVKPDPAGKFAFKNVPKPSEGALHVIARGDLSSGVAEVPAAPWPPRSVEIHLSPAATLAGRVVGPDEEPIAAAKVGFGAARAATGADGSFSFRVDARDADGRATLAATADGYAWAFLAEDFRTPLSTPRIVRLERGQAVEGVVRTASGAPAAGALVLIDGKRFLPGNLTNPRLDKMIVETRLHTFETRRTRAAADGTFRIPNLPAEALLLSARMPGLPSPDIPHESRPPESGVVLVLASAPAAFGTIEGRVVERTTREAITNFRAFVTTDWGIVRATASGDGAFRIERCPAGSWRLRVAPGAGAPFSPAERLVRVDPNETAREVVVEVAGRGRAEIRVTGAPKDATEGLTLSLSPVEGDALAEPPLEAGVVRRGLATIEDLPPGTYSVAVESGHYALAAPARLQVESGRTAQARVSLVSGKSLVVVVTARDGEATLAPYGVRVREAESGSLVFDRRAGLARALSGGGARVVLPPGSYVATLERGDQRIAEQRVALGDDGAFAVFEIAADPPS